MGKGVTLWGMGAGTGIVGPYALAGELAAAAASTWPRSPAASGACAATPQPGSAAPVRAVSLRPVLDEMNDQAPPELVRRPSALPDPSGRRRRSGDGARPG